METTRCLVLTNHKVNCESARPFARSLSERRGSSLFFQEIRYLLLTFRRRQSTDLIGRIDFRFGYCWFGFLIVAAGFGSSTFGGSATAGFGSSTVVSGFASGPQVSSILLDAGTPLICISGGANQGRQNSCAFSSYPAFRCCPALG